MRYKKIIVYVEIYLIFTIVLFFVGPIRWDIPSPTKLIIYLALISIMLGLGFQLYFRNRNACIYDIEQRYFLPDNLILNHLKYMLVFNIIIFSMYLVRNLGGNSLSFANIITWITNPSAQYMAKFENSIGTFGKIAAALATFASFFLWATIPLGIMYFKKLRIPWRVLVILNIIVEAVRWLAMGTNKGIIDLVMIILCFLFYSMILKDTHLGKKGLYIIVAAILVVIGLSYFSININGRVDGSYTYLMNNLGGNSLDLNDNFLLKLLPGLKSLIIYADSYFTQGYYGLALGMEQDFTPMFGMGNSVFLRENIEEIFNCDLFQYTYMHKIDSLGWSEKSNWHSAYLWFANDFGFVGTLVVVLILGYYFAFICYHLFEGENRLFFPLLCMMIQMFFYFPMNNQIFNMPFSFMGFVGMNLYLFLLRYKAIRPKYYVFGKRW